MKRGTDPSDETAEGCERLTEGELRLKVLFNRWLIAAGNSHSLAVLCVTHGDGWSKDASKPARLLYHMETQHPALKDKSGDFQKERNVNTKNKT